MTDRPAFSHRRERHGLIGPFSGRKLLVGFVAILVAVVLLVAVNTPLGNTAGAPGLVDPRATAYLLGSPPPVGLKVGQAAPELAVTGSDGTTHELTDLQARPIRLADLKGKAVWINFWTTWCPPCQAEMPTLRKVSQEYRDQGLELVAISVQETSPGDVAAYAQRYGLDYTIGFDGSGDIFRAYKGYGLPTQVFIDPNGVIASIVAAPLDEAGAVAQIQRILPASSAGSPIPSAGPS